tara:strand:+ start:14078 stop:15463 length:1386 start_codon:yes stop_codon:yes gene_type:complete
MSIVNTNINTQTILFSKEKKEKYGEIFTPYTLIHKMFELIDHDVFTDPNNKWLDPGAGTGFFSIFLFWKLDSGLSNIIKNIEERRKHIIENMIYMVEIQQENIETLKNIFGKNANIFNLDFVTDSIKHIKFSYIIGNPPYNINGVKKVPTNREKNKKKDGQTLWFEFIKTSLKLLVKNGKLIMIVPSIWMKPNKSKAYDFMCQYQIDKIHCLSNTETNKIFNGNAQTPTCYFLLRNTKSNNNINIFDVDKSTYVKYNIKINYPIPIFGAHIINKFMKYVNLYGSLNVIKTNMPSKNVKLNTTYSKDFPYKNINSAKISSVGNKPYLDIKYSNESCKYYKQIKLILPHKMYGFPYLDTDGSYGICNRDNYVILDDNIDNLNIVKEFLSTKTALYIYEATRYRMKYLEKYAFKFIPNILVMADFIKKRPLDDKYIWDFFDFDVDDIININKLHQKNYDFEYLI